MGRSIAGFSLVELLVVICIISVLAALLLPVLEETLEGAHRTYCLNNLRQSSIGLQSFADDYDGQLAFMPSPLQDDTVYSNADYFHRFAKPGSPTGWCILYDRGYITSDIFYCPSMDYKTAFLSTTYRMEIHYGYRYNSLRSLISSEGHKVNGVSHTSTVCFPNEICYRKLHGIRISDREFAKKIIFSDATDYRGTGFLYHENTKGTLRRWAHHEGGNIVDGTGRAIWILTSKTPPWPTTDYILADELLK